jgi:hypothetical protein
LRVPRLFALPNQASGRRFSPFRGVQPSAGRRPECQTPLRLRTGLTPRQIRFFTAASRHCAQPIPARRETTQQPSRFIPPLAGGDFWPRLLNFLSRHLVRISAADLSTGRSL